MTMTSGGECLASYILRYHQINRKTIYLQITLVLSVLCIKLYWVYTGCQIALLTLHLNTLEV